MKVLLEQLINSNYIRYDRLTNIVNTAFVGSNATKLNIYIDLYSILKGLYKNNNYNIEDYSTVTSCIVNMIAHYRHFFKNRYGVDTKFYLVYSKNIPYTNNQFCKNYNSKTQYAYGNKLVDDMIYNNIKLLEILCPYLPDIFFINGTFETGVIIYDLICRNELEDINTPHVILTKDPYNYQLVAMRDNIIIFRPKKVNGDDLSFFINKRNVMLYYLASRKSSADNNIKTLMPETLTLLMTLSSVPERNIKLCCNIKTAIKTIKDAIDNYKIINGYNVSPASVWMGINNGKLPISQIEFENRFKAIDIQFQHLIYVNTAEAKQINLLNLYDPEAVKAINNQYFKDNPLDLNVL